MLPAFLGEETKFRRIAYSWPFRKNGASIHIGPLRQTDRHTQAHIHTDTHTHKDTHTDTHTHTHARKREHTRETDMMYRPGKRDNAF